MKKHLNIIVFGKVVDVDYRFYAKQAAGEFGITGFAKNIGQSQVYMEVEGEDSQLQEFIKWCRKGSPWSEVKSLDISEGKLKNFSSFERIN